MLCVIMEMTAWNLVQTQRLSRLRIKKLACQQSEIGDAEIVGGYGVTGLIADLRHFPLVGL